jgi:hypothetical protein
MNETQEHRNAYAEAELDRLRIDLLERIDDADGPASTAGGGGMSLAEECDDEALPEAEPMVEIDLAGYLQRDNQ